MLRRFRFRIFSPLNFVLLCCIARRIWSAPPGSSPRSAQSSTQLYRTRLQSLVHTSMLALFPSVAVAAAGGGKGAFEMDAEFYLRNLLDAAATAGGGGRATDASRARRPIYASPRTLAPECGELLDVVQRQISSAARVPVEAVRANVTAQLPLYLPFFKQYAPLRREDLTDQYFFDVNVYLSYLIAEARIPDSAARGQLRDRVGDAVLAWLRAKGLVGRAGERRSTAGAAASISQVLVAFQRLGVIESFSFDDENLTDGEYVASLFDEDLPVSVQATFNAPATLLGAIQMAASDTRFRPDIVGAALSRSVAELGFTVLAEDYLLDNFYREENDDVQAQSILLELLISQ